MRAGPDPRHGLADPLELGAGLLVPPYSDDEPSMTGAHVRLAYGGRGEDTVVPDHDLVYCFASGHGDMFARGAQAEWPFPVDHTRIVFVAAGVTHRIENRGLGELHGYAFAVPPRPDAPDAERRPHKMTYGVYSGKVELESGRRCYQPVFKPNPASRISSIELAEFAEDGRTVRHCSRSTEEIFYFVRGRGEVLLGDTLHAVGPGDAVLVPQGVPHEIRNVGAGVMSHFTVNMYLYGTDAE